MDFGEIIPYIITALGGGSAGWLVNWKWGRRKDAAIRSKRIIATVDAYDYTAGYPANLTF